MIDLRSCKAHRRNRRKIIAPSADDQLWWHGATEIYRLEEMDVSGDQHSHAGRNQTCNGVALEAVLHGIRLAIRPHRIEWPV